MFNVLASVITLEATFELKPPPVKYVTVSIVLAGI